MGLGLDLARADAPEHAQMMDDLKDQLLIVLIKRLADAGGKLSLPAAEIDDTAQDMLLLAVDPDTRVFTFTLKKKT